MYQYLPFGRSLVGRWELESGEQLKTIMSALGMSASPVCQSGQCTEKESFAELPVALQCWAQQGLDVWLIHGRDSQRDTASASALSIKA
jgi:hypothetical protein